MKSLPRAQCVLHCLSSLAHSIVQIEYIAEMVEGKFFLWDCEVTILFCDTKLRLKFCGLKSFHPPNFLGYCVLQNIQWEN